MMSIDEYNQLRAVNYSTLKHMRKSPLAYRYACDHHSEPTLAMLKGTATHVLTLEPENFDKHIAEWEGDRRGKAWEAFRDANSTRAILRTSELAESRAMASAVRSDPYAMRYLTAPGRAAEVPMVWTDPGTGLKCKGRADLICTIDDQPQVVGLKTTRDIAETAFMWQAFRLGYHLQWAFYHDGYQAIHGHAPRMVEIVVESSPPHECVVYVIPDDVLAVGRDEYRALLSRVRECLDAGSWPGLGAEGERLFALPDRAYDMADEIDLDGLDEVA